MPIPAHELLSILQTALPGAVVEVKALVDDDDHYAVTITASQFVGLSRVQQHQLVNKALQGKLGTQLHALSIKTIALKP
ncbi:MAG: BolA family transcriptional regulator [Alphaproteobacteria bacterium]|nr:BolA family transcriptional regulator [Alphaproteobacteria bacterium]